MAKKPEVKTPVVKTPVVKAEKSVEVKNTAPVVANAASTAKATEVKEAAKVVKETAQTAVKGTAQKAVKKVATKAKKATKAKVVAEPNVFIQYEDNGTQEASVADIVAKVKAIYVADGHRESSIKSLEIYMKPQEWAAYYVINNKVSGRIDLF